MDWDEERIVVHLRATVEFLKRHERLWQAHIVEFFRERLWELLDVEWLQALQSAELDELLLLPSHVSKVCWPGSLKMFLEEARSLSLPRAIEGSELFSECSAALPRVVIEGMNPKKLHEIQRLSSVVVNVARAVHATEVVDVGAGQGYLAQVLSFQHSLSVVAVDCSAHNVCVTNQRAERIRKYYTNKRGFASPGPRSIACQIGSNEGNMSLKSFLSSAAFLEAVDESRKLSPAKRTSVVLAGLHACGDLSSNMLRTFVHCDDVTALVSVGCCYNLLSEETDINTASHSCGFPLSEGVKALELRLGGAGRDLGCQSPDRWKEMGQNATLNFEVHAYRAAFQIALHRFYPDTAMKNPSVGRLGKSKRRKQTASNVRRTPSAPSFAAFQDYTLAGLKRLGLPDIRTHKLHEIWEEVHPFLRFIAPFWSFRAAFAPVLESLLLLDRLLFLKEQSRRTDVSFTSVLLPVFEARISPRNLAILATKFKR